MKQGSMKQGSGAIKQGSHISTKLSKTGSKGSAGKTASMKRGSKAISLQGEPDNTFQEGNPPAGEDGEPNTEIIEEEEEEATLEQMLASKEDETCTEEDPWLKYLSLDEEDQRRKVPIWCIAPECISHMEHEALRLYDFGNILELTGWSPRVVETALEHVYTGHAAAFDELAWFLLPFAHTYGFEGLKLACEWELSRQVDSSHAPLLLVLAHDAKADKLKQNVLQYIKKNSDEVSDYESWHLLVENNSALAKEAIHQIISPSMKYTLLEGEKRRAFMEEERRKAVIHLEREREYVKQVPKGRRLSMGEMLHARGRDELGKIRREESEYRNSLAFLGADEHALRMARRKKIIKDMEVPEPPLSTEHSVASVTFADSRHSGNLKQRSSQRKSGSQGSMSKGVQQNRSGSAARITSAKTT